MLAATALAGCQGEDAPTPAPLPTETPTTPTPTTPKSTDADAKSAEAFARHYFEVVTFAGATGDTALLATLGRPQCSSCAAIVENVEAIYGAGGHLESNGWSVRSIEKAFEGPNHTFVLDLRVDLAEERVFKQGVETPEFHEATVRGMVMTIQFKRGAWRVQNLEITQ